MGSLEARRSARIDFATADWQRNEFGVDMLFLSRDPGNGAVGFALELLACAGRGVIDDEPWHRGCYQFGGPSGDCHVAETLEFYCRAFRVED